MVSVSKESPDQTEQRLLGVLETSEFVVHEGAWAFREVPLTETPNLETRMLAVVRDDDRWSCLVPAEDAPDADERFGVFSFHFPPSVDNSGFVGWLASTLKARLGTGVFVVCGSNRNRGGIFDYWGFPLSMLDETVQLVEELRRG